MRSVADLLRREDRTAVRSLSPSERVMLALALGDRDLERFRAAQAPSVDRVEAARLLDRRRQRGRRASACIAELIG